MKYLIIYVAISMFSTNIIAQHSENEHSDHHTEKSQDNKHNHKKHDVHKHHIALFGGITTNLTHEVNLLTFGVDYEYRLPFVHNKFGVGFNAEYLTGETTEKLLGLNLFYHPIGGLKFVTAPMFAIVE